MKFQLLAFLLAFLFVIPSYAQKIKRVNVRVNYVSLPNKKLPDGHTTYSIKYNNPQLAGSVRLDGFEEVEEGGHLNVLASTGNYKQSNAIPKQQERTNKDKDGNVTSRWTEYWYEIPFYTKAHYKVFDHRDLEITRRNIEVRQTMKTAVFRSAKERNDNFNANAASQERNFNNIVCGKVKDALQGYLNSEYAFKVTSGYMEVQRIKKHSTEKDFEDAFNLTKKVFADLEANEAPAQAKADMAAAMDFWKEWVGEKPSGDKKAMAAYYVSCHNLAFTSYYLDDFAAAEKFATLLLDAKGKDAHSNGLLKRITRLREKMELHGVRTLHHDRAL